MRNRLLLAVIVLVVFAGAAWILVPRGGASDGTPTTREAASGAGPRPAADPVREPTLAGRPAAEGAATPAVAWADAPFRGVVVDEAGKPIAGAIVRVTDADGIPPAATDGEGRFAFAPAGVDEERDSVECRASSVDHVQGRDDVTVDREKEARIALLPACFLRVLVTDARTRAAVPGAKIVVVDDGWASLFEADVFGEAVADAQGRARFPLVGGACLAVATADGYAPAVSPSVLVAAEGAEVEVALERGGTLDGVILQPDGAPAAGAWVRIDAYPRFRRELAAGPEGTFRVEGVPFTPPDLALWETRLAVRARPAGATGPHRCVEVEPPKPGATVTVRVTLSRWQRLVGTVRRSDGTPVADVEVAAGFDDWQAPHRDCDLGETDKAKTGPNGAFALEHVPPGRVSVGVPSKSGLGTSVDVMEDPAPDPIKFVLREDERPSLRARVVDAEGRPVDATVFLLPSVGDRESATTDHEGRVAFPSVPAGLVVLVTEPSGGGPTKAVTVDDFGVGSPEIDIRVGDGVVEGRVSHMDGTPAHVAVDLYLPVPRGTGTLYFSGDSIATDDAGHFRFADVSEGEYRVATTTSDHHMVGDWVAARAGDRDVRLVVARPAEAASLHVEAMLVDAATGAALTADADVRLVDPHAADPADAVWSSEEVTGSPGTWRTYLVPPGTYDLVASADGFREARVRGVRVAATGGPTRVTVSLAVGGVVEGNVRWKNGGPVGLADVEAGDRSTTTDTAGAFRLSGLDDGPITVRVSGTHVVGTPTKTVATSAARPARADFEVEAGGAMTFSRPSTAAPAAVSIRTQCVADGDTRTFAITEDEFRARLDSGRGVLDLFEGLRPGAWRVEASWGGAPLVPRVVTVVAGETVTVPLGPP